SRDPRPPGGALPGRPARGRPRPRLRPEPSRKPRLAAGRRLPPRPPRGCPLPAASALAFLAAAAFAGELLRAGEGPQGAPRLLLAAAACRLLLALAAGEAVAPGRPLLALAAGLLLPVYFLVLPPELRRLLAAGGRTANPARARRV